METQDVAQIQQVLERLLKDGALDKGQMEVYLSKYSKAWELLNQALANERVHAHNIADLQCEQGKIEQLMQGCARQQSVISQSIFKVRQQLSELDRQNSSASDQSVANTGKITALGEELLILQQQLKSLKQLRAEELEPKISEAERRIRDVKDLTYKQAGIEKELTEQLQQQQELLDRAEIEAKAVQDALKKLEQNKTFLEGQPEACKRQAALVKQGMQAAEVDRNKKQRAVDIIEQGIQAKNHSIQSVQAVTEETIKQSRALKEQIQQEIHPALQEQQQVLQKLQFDLQGIKEEFGVLASAERKIKLERDFQQKTYEDALKDVRAAERKLMLEQQRLQARAEMEGPLQEKKQNLIDEKNKEIARYQQLKERLAGNQDALAQEIIAHATELGNLDACSQQIVQQATQNKEFQEQIFKYIKEIRALQIETISLQSQRQAANQRYGKLQAALRQTQNALQIKDTELERLQVEKHGLETKTVEFGRMYEQLKTQKNRLQRLSQEARLAIQEVQEKIEVLKCETAVLNQDTQNKQQTLQRQQIEARNAQRQVQTVRQECSQAKTELMESYQRITRQIAEIKALGDAIIAKERQIFALKDSYLKTIEQRNVAGLQLVRRNDELCAYHEKLKAQEAVAKEAEQFMCAREEDARVMELMKLELLRDREILQRRIGTELPEMITERNQLLDEVSKIRLDNEQLLQDIRTTAAVKSAGSEQVSVLNLSSLYNKGSTVGQSLAKQPPKTLQQIENKVFATWNMVGSIKAIDPATLAAKQKKIESYIRQVSQISREKFNLDDELNKMISDLQNSVEEQRSKVPATITAELNAAKSDLSRTQRSLMSTVSQVQFQQQTCARLEQVSMEIADELKGQQERLEQGMAPTEEAEHEWLVSRQNHLDYLRDLRMRQELIAAQVPGAKPTKAAPRFDCYVEGETGLPKPYGARPPLQPAVIGIQQQRFVKKPKQLEIEL